MTINIYYSRKQCYSSCVTRRVFASFCARQIIDMCYLFLYKIPKGTILFISSSNYVKVANSHLEGYLYYVNKHIVNSICIQTGWLEVVAYYWAAVGFCHSSALAYWRSWAAVSRSCSNSVFLTPSGLDGGSMT